MSISPNTAVVVAVAAAVLYSAYLWALPKPIKGIPHNAGAAKSILGDLPSLQKEFNTRGDLFLWIRDQALKTGSPISQVFPVPLGKPWVILADPREARDTQLNRGKEFDRSWLVIDTFTPLTGTMMFTLKTGPEWKRHRRLAQDTMTPNFLREVAAPNIYASSLRFLDLWTKKSLLSNGRPFSAESDLFYATTDGVLAFNFGSDFPHSAIKSQLEGVEGVSPDDLIFADALDEPVQFPVFNPDEEIASLLGLVKAMDKVQGRPLPWLQWFIAKRTSSYQRMEKIKRECIRRNISYAEERFNKRGNGVGEPLARNSVDLIINREAKLAERENRKPDFYSDIICSDLFGFLVAGLDTTSSSMCWAVKVLARQQSHQTRLREELQSAFAAAISEHRQPTAQELTSTSIPYLDAVIEELFRLVPVVPLNSREATQDTQLFGHRISKGTLVIYLNNGPGYTLPSCKVDESRRSKQSQQDEKDARYKSWDDDDITIFKPERWLVQQNDNDDSGDGGKFIFDPNAGPFHGFGLGMRSCFGRRLAYIQFRIFLAMIIWNFELLDCPEKLSSNIGTVGVVYKPNDCYVRLKQVNHPGTAA